MVAASIGWSALFFLAESPPALFLAQTSIPADYVLQESVLSLPVHYET